MENMLSTFGFGLNLLGGLAIFLYGLKVMASNLQRASSEKLKSFFEFWTQNKAMGLMFGAAVTSILQSSSATTVMLVGFANAGVIKLAQSISIIFGANVGTTITAQIIAFKASNMALPLMGIGGLLFLFGKRPKLKTLGEILIGLGLIFFGLSQMGVYLKPLKDSVLFNTTMVQLGHMPILGILAGLVITVMIQSSSATTGMIIALGTQGLIDFQTAFILELGSNIGTTITAQIAAIGTNTNAKRVAWSHTLFNVIGSAYMAILLYVTIEGQPIFLKLVDWITPGNGFAGENSARHIANAHTLFNISNAIILFPFINQIAKITEKIIKEKPDRYNESKTYIDDRMATSPVIALQQAGLEAKHMTEITKDLSRQVYQVLFKNKDQALNMIEVRCARLEQVQDQIVDFLVHINNKLNNSDVEKSNAIIHIVEHLKRIADQNKLMMENYHQLQNLKKGYPEEEYKQIKHLYQLIQEMFYTLIKSYPGETFDADAISLFNSHNKKAIELENELRRQLVKLIRKKDISPKAGFYFGELITHLDTARDQMSKINHRILTLQ